MKSLLRPAFFSILLASALVSSQSWLYATAQAPVLMSVLNQCDNREWTAENWSGQVQTTLAYVPLQGTPCLQAAFQCSADSQYVCIRPNQYVYPEDWSGVSALKMDVYIQSASSKNIAMELKDPADNSIQKVYANNIATGAWVTVTWPLAPFTQNVSSLFIISENLQNNDVLYFSNLRLVRNGQDELWESFASPSYAWEGGDDFAPWMANVRNEPISHNHTHNNSPGAVCMPWDASINGCNDAKVEARNLHGLDFTQFNHVGAWVYSSRTDTPVYAAFWDGANWVPTDQKAIAAANTWQYVEWFFPAGINYAGLQTFMFMVNTTAGGTGMVYVDDLNFSMAATPTPTPTFTPTATPAPIVITMSSLNQCDNREWTNRNLSSTVQTSLAYTYFQGRNSLQANYQTTQVNDVAGIQVNQAVAPENWNGPMLTTGVSAVKVDLFIESAVPKTMALLPLDANGASIETDTVNNIPTNAWVTVTFPSHSFPYCPSAVTNLEILTENLQNGDVIHYSNLRLVRNGQEEPWESFASPSYAWRGGDNFAPWMTGVRNEPISHNLAHAGSPASVYLPWNASLSASADAKVEAMNLRGQDFTRFNYAGAWVYSSRADTPVYLAFWDGSHWVPTDQRPISAPNTWLYMEWSKPAGISWNSLSTFMFMVNTSAGGTGYVYVDDFSFSASPALTMTATPSVSPTPTCTRTQTPTPTASVTPTRTITQTSTITCTVTTTPTFTVTPTMVASSPLACDTHQWEAQPWDGYTQTTLTYTQFQGQNCLAAGFTTPLTAGYACFRPKDFLASPEDWTNVTAVKMDVFIQSPTPKNMSLELKDSTDTSVQKVYVNTINAGSWITLTWPFTPVSTVAGIFITPVGLQNNDVIYFANLRLVRNNLEEMWDSFAAPSYGWQGSGNFTHPLFDGAYYEPISHNHTHNGSAGAVSIPWNAAWSTGTEAAVQTANLLGGNFSQFNQVSAWVYSDRTDAPICMAFQDNTQILRTTSQTVAAANTWQLLQWTKPAGINGSRLQGFTFIVSTAAGGTGHVYVDDLNFTPGSLQASSQASAACIHPKATLTATTTATVTASATPRPTQTMTDTATPAGPCAGMPTFTPTPARNAAGDRLIAYPNPAKGKVTFSWSASDADSSRVEIYNLAGERIARIQWESRGNNFATWDAAQVPAGIYLYQIVLTKNGHEERLGLKKVAIIR